MGDDPDPHGKRRHHRGKASQHALEQVKGIGPVLDERLPAPVEAAAYYIASEALTNVAKHASSPSASRSPDADY